MGSKSKSSSSSTTENKDNRVVAEHDAVVINSGSELTIVDEFPEDIKDLVYDIIGFAGDVGQAALDVTTESMGTVKDVNRSLGERLTSIEQGGANNFIGIAALTVVAIIALKIWKGK